MRETAVQEENEELSQAAQRGRAIYETRLKAILEPAENNRFVAIHPESGTYTVANSTGEALRKMRGVQPQGRLYFTKIGPEPEYGLSARILTAEMAARKQSK